MAVGDQRAGELRVPLRVADSYVRPGDEQRLFPNFTCYLTRDEVFEVFPKGHITHEKFEHGGYWYRLVKRPASQGNSTYLAVMDGAQPPYNGATPQSSSATGCVTPDSARVERIRSLPLDSFSNGDVADASSACSEITLGSAGAQHPHSSNGGFGHAASMPPALLSGPPTSRLHSLPPVPISGGGSMRSMALVSAHNSGAVALPSPTVSLASAFMTDLMTATENPMPMERYKAFVRLFSTLKRMRAAQGLPQQLPVVLAPQDDECGFLWDRPEAQELMTHMFKVGECLAKFGTADFVEGRNNNSSRAITTKDYAKLLRMYLEDNGAVFVDGFISRLPITMQDEALSVRGLLQTRCETNALLFDQLVKSVGREPAGGGAMVFNTSTISANPTNHMLAAPKTLVNTVSNAWSKADVKKRTQFGAVAAVGLIALWVLKRKLFGGGGGGHGGERRGRRRGDVSEESEWGGSSRRRGSSVRSSLDLTSRLMDDRSSAERMAVRFISACQDELRRAAHNDALLRNDWRLGPLRIAPLGSGSVPTGYESVHTNYCSVASYMNALDGGMPLVAPPLVGGAGGGFPDRMSDRLSGGGGSVGMPSPRESVAGGLSVAE